MKIKNKPIQAVRIRNDRAEKLKAKAFSISVQVGEFITEADLINFLIDNALDKIVVDNKELILDE